jgi:hypothetical protein
MFTIINILKIIIGLGLLNVWIIRFNKASSYRGGDAKNMIEEFKAYRLPQAVMYLVGFLKVVSALVLIISVFINDIEKFALYTICLLMIGAIIMHLIIKDPFRKSLPALSLLILTLAAIALSSF